MKKNIHVINKRTSVSLNDDIVYSRTSDDGGKPIDLYMSILLHNVNVERKVIADDVEKKESERHPAILCIPGGGFTHCERNRILPELQFLAEEGYVIASIDYRLSSMARFPAQMEDVCNAIKYLKAHARQYHIDAARIGVLGRSAGGCLALTAGMNQGIGDCGSDYGAYSPGVKAVCSMYGVTDLPHWMEYEIKSQYFSKAKTAMETKGGQYAGKEKSAILKEAENASPIYHINKDMAPVLILHGDNDPVVPLEQSGRFYEKMKEMGLEDKADFYIVSNAGHGSKEFFQEDVKRIMSEYFKLNL